MPLIVLTDAKYGRRFRPSVSISTKLRRLSINRSCIELIEKESGKEFTHVQILIDPEISNCFWIRPSEPDESGARRLNVTTGSTRTVSCSHLLEYAKWNDAETKSFFVEWDGENKAVKVDLSKVR